MVLAWLFPDENSTFAQSVIRGALGERPRAPSILMLEVGNALVQAERRGRIGSRMRADLLGAFVALPIGLEPITAEAATRATVLAVQHQLTLYDASYLELALARRCPLATLDRPLAAAAREEGVTVLDTPAAPTSR